MTSTTTNQPNKPSTRSTGWIHFQRMTVDDRLKARCLVDGCTTILSTPSHCTSTLIRRRHDVHRMKDFHSKDLPRHSKKKRISSHLKKRLDDAVMLAIVEDGRSFNDFSKKVLNKFIQVILPSKRTIYNFGLLYRCCLTSRLPTSSSVYDYEETETPSFENFLLVN